MEQLIALFREQNALLAACSGVKVPDQPTAPQALPAEPPPVNAPIALVSPEAASAKVLAGVARVSLFSADALRTDQTLVGDLGFDSLMLTELTSGLASEFPQLSFEPNDFTMETTLGTLIDYVVERVSISATGDALVRAAVPLVQASASVESPPASPVSSEAYRIEDFPEVKALAERIAMGEQLGLANPYFVVHDGVIRDTSKVDGRELITFSSYNYIGMSGHPAVVAAVQQAVATYGSSCSASRMLSGEKPIHKELEAELAGLLGTEDALALVSGHATLVTVIGHLAGPGDLLLHDSLAHNSITQGCKLSGATSRPFPHNDHATLDRILGSIRHQYRRVFILIEGVYSMDGDIPDLPAFIEIKKRHRALLLIDEAHSIGVLGAKGGGIGEHFGVDRRDVELWAGTMSKSLAGCGGYVGGSRELIRYLRYSTPGFIYSVGITPPNAAASLAAIRQMRAEPEVLARLRDRSSLFLKLAKAAGVKVGPSHDSPVIPCIVGDSIKTVKLAAALFKRGINVMPILYPAVPESMTRLRFFVTSCHTEEQIRTTVQVLAEELALLEVTAVTGTAEAELVEATQTTA